MSQDILTSILQKKQEEVEAARRAVPEVQLRKEARNPRVRHSFLEKLSAPGPFGTNIIAEIKRGSPSRGAMRADLDPQAYGRSYERAGAAAISVLTDKTFFMGSPQDLKAVRGVVDLPVLRKDFVVSTYQIYEAAAWGADAVLLIVRALSPEFLKAGIELARELGLDALVEVHSREELETATAAGAQLVGINNRDLRTFQTDIQTSVQLARLLEPGQVAVAESGIHTRAQIEALQGAGIFNFLIGESLVKAADPEPVLRHLLGR
ncbi:indole-3-glycerol phosphate synthase TrpC [Desulforhabdus sp. TSK]|uniref:indole-3-glycerol phosphate synthase TrpC n=1 Tax=Desulforhabdus sp. TSK TaxID=2925014 RepID=UPI001FC7BCCF|nr:indole-3-glycerol phosphate synthase TrpC [Desulforhabdus sp. TSK]GKT08970.1 indole-3-glycerol phosphate synthase [Desulforhabdus sp. TSK]